MKNILFIHYGGESIRGSEVCLLNLLAHIDRTVFHPVAICNRKPMQEELEKLNVLTYLMCIPEIMIDGDYRKLEFIQYFRTLGIVRKIIKENGIHLVYSNSGLPSQMAYPLSQFRGIPLICHIHAEHPKRYAWIWLFKYADKVLFVSRNIRDSLVAKVNFAGETRVVHNGIDTAVRFNPDLHRDPSLRSRHGIRPGDIVIGQVGSLVSYKGADLLIRAIARLSDRYDNLRLLFIGDGVEKQNLVRMADELGIACKVTFAGEIRDTERYLSSVLDIHVLASKTEGLGLALIEASSCGLPNVASRCGGIPEVVEDGGTGFLFDKNDVDQLADRLSRLIRNPDLRKRMGERGRDKVVREMDVDRYTRNIEKEILELLD